MLRQNSRGGHPLIDTVSVGTDQEKALGSLILLKKDSCSTHKNFHDESNAWGSRNQGHTDIIFDSFYSSARNDHHICPMDVVILATPQRAMLDSTYIHSSLKHSRRDAYKATQERADYWRHLGPNFLGVLLPFFIEWSENGLLDAAVSTSIRIRGALGGICGFKTYTPGGKWPIWWDLRRARI